MSDKFSKPHSYVSPPSRQQYRERTYPYVISKRKSIDPLARCEACLKASNHLIHYYVDKNSIDESTIFLCNDHEKLTRYGKFDQVFRDMDRKIDKESKDEKTRIW